ncbi:CLUMA_CG019177, isoform A [Clunio marinus]|uniref:CLUMA_CG019177, isoform A n=1 Tax=Clunio marinus TaxID=568069 RepID=A0A1J1J129_9DIPT|nr:CLUMA_CG019177, isoform A [Clunio marinus]
MLSEYRKWDKIFICLTFVGKSQKKIELDPILTYIEIVFVDDSPINNIPVFKFTHQLVDLLSNLSVINISFTLFHRLFVALNDLSIPYL